METKTVVTPLMTNWMPMTAVIRPMIFETIRCPVGPIQATIDGAARRHARNAARLRSAGESEVIETKIGAAEIGLMTEKRDENARNANCWSEGVSIVSPHYPGSANREGGAPGLGSRSALNRKGS